MLKLSRSILLFSLMAVLCGIMLPSHEVRALNVDSRDVSLPAMDTFVDQVMNGQAGELRGIYIPNIIAARVVQQPSGMDAFISPWENVVT